MQDFIAIKEINGTLNSNLFLEGNTEESANIDIEGSFDLRNLSITDTLNTKLAGLNKLNVNVNSVNPAKDIYEISAIKIDSLYVNYEVYPQTDNFTQLFILADSTQIVTEEESTSNVFVMIKDYVVETLHGIKASNFSIDTVALSNFDLLYFDHSILQEFKYRISETNLTAYAVKSDADSLVISLTSLLNNKGKLKATATLHPKKPEDLTISLSIEKLVMKDLSPYFHQYVAFPVTKGLLNMTCNLTAKDKQLDSYNDLVLHSFKLGKKQKHDEAYNLPLKLAIAMLKDREGTISINIPVEGDLANPDYKVWKAVGKVFNQLIFKAASSPYKLIAGGFETDEESIKRITIDNSSSILNEKHHKKLDAISTVLIDKPELLLLVEPYYSLKEETQKLALMLAKADYLGIKNKDVFTSDEIDKINMVNEKDSLFMTYVNRKLKQEEHSLSIADKTSKLYSQSLLKQQIQDHLNDKFKYIHSYLLSKGVKNNQLQNVSSVDVSLYENTEITNVQYRFMFDVLDEEETIIE